MRTKIDKAYWQRILGDSSAAKEALQYLEFDGGARVEFVELSNGNRIKVEDVTEEQAHEFMSSICPTWAKD